MELSVAYSNCVKSFVPIFEQFLAEVDQKGIVIPDESTVASFRNIGKTLQRILSKWDKNKPLTEQDATKNSSNPSSVQSSSKKLFHESFLYDEPVDKSKNVTVAVTDSEKSDASISPKKPMNSDFAERMKKKFKKNLDDSGEESDESSKPTDHAAPRSKSPIDENSGEEYLNDASIKKITDLTYECQICSKELSKNNVKSHVNGKQHMKNRSRSQERKLSVNNGGDILDCVLDGVKEELRKNKDGISYIETRNSVNESYYCNVCKLDVPKFNTNLLQHLTGSQHKRMTTNNNGS